VLIPAERFTEVQLVHDFLAIYINLRDLLLVFSQGSLLVSARPLVFSPGILQYEHATVYSLSLAELLAFASRRLLVLPPKETTSDARRVNFAHGVPPLPSSA
jgi:hypothetical protein